MITSRAPYNGPLTGMTLFFFSFFFYDTTGRVAPPRAPHRGRFGFSEIPTFINICRHFGGDKSDEVNGVRARARALRI